MKKKKDKESRSCSTEAREVCLEENSSEIVIDSPSKENNEQTGKNEKKK
jgi:hypothetical protein